MFHQDLPVRIEEEIKEDKKEFIVSFVGSFLAGLFIFYLWEKHGTKKG